MSIVSFDAPKGSGELNVASDDEKEAKRQASKPECLFGFVPHRTGKLPIEGKVGQRDDESGNRHDTNPPRPLTEWRITAISACCSVENDGESAGVVRENNGGNDDFNRGGLSFNDLLPLCLSAVLFLPQRKENHRNGILILGLPSNFCPSGVCFTGCSKISTMMPKMTSKFSYIFYFISKVQGLKR